MTQIVFEQEKKYTNKLPYSILKDIIKSENSTLSRYLIRFGAYKTEDLTSIDRKSRPTNGEPDTLIQDKILEIFNPTPIVQVVESATKLPISDTIELLPGVEGL